MKIEIIKCLQDNYSYLVIDETNNSACVIDPSESKPLIKFIEKKGINLKFILNTHHHADHIGGTKALIEYFPNVKDLNKYSDDILKYNMLLNIL